MTARSIASSISNLVSQLVALAESGGGGPTGSVTASDLTPDEGDTLTLTFTESPVSGDTLTYQWRFNATPLSNVGDISGVTTDELTVANVEDADSGVYSVVVTNTATGLSRTFSKTVGVVVPTASVTFDSTSITFDSTTTTWDSL